MVSPRDREYRAQRRLVIGLLLVVWVGALQLMLDKGKELDWFASAEILTLGLVALVAFAVFVVWELTDKHPVVDLRLFKGRNFAFGALALSVAYGLFFGNVVLMPLWLQQWMGYTATSAGMALAPVGFLAILLTPLVGKKVGQWDPRRMATGAFIVFALVLWLVCWLGLWVLPMIILFQGETGRKVGLLCIGKVIGLSCG